MVVASGNGDGWVKKQVVADCAVSDRAARRRSGVRSAPAARTTRGAQTVNRRPAPNNPDSTDNSSATNIDLVDGCVGENARAVSGRGGEVLALATLLRPTTTSKGARATVCAPNRVALGRRGLPAERCCAVQNRLVLGSD